MAFITEQPGTRFPFLSIPDQEFILKPHQIDLWLYPLQSLWTGAEGILNPEELQRANRYHFERHRRRFILARGFLRLILARYLKQKAADLVFTTNRYGKPAILHPSAIEFNLSHSQDWAILAIGQQHALGVDIEYFSGRALQGISKMMFSPRELAAFMHIPAATRLFAFFQVWAQKEAFIKAVGMGLSYPTQDFDVPVGRFETAEVWDTKHNQLWHMRSFMPKIACCAALCHHPSIRSIRYRVLQDHDDLK